MFIDHNQFLEFQNRLNTRKFYRWFWTFWSFYGVGYIVAAMIILLASPEGREVLPAVVIAYFLSWPFIAHFCAWMFPKARPYQRYQFMPVASSVIFSRIHQTPNSFPSRHTMAMAAVSWSIYATFPVLGMIGFLVTVLVGFGRVVLGYHYVSDIVAGLLLGIAAAVISQQVIAPIIFT